MTFSPFQILLLVLIGGFFIFAIVDRICKCVEHKATAISFAAFSQNTSSNVSVQDIDAAMDKLEKNSARNKSN